MLKLSKRRYIKEYLFVTIFLIMLFLLVFASESVAASISYISAEELPPYPDIPGSPQDVYKPTSNFKTLDLITGFAIIGVPDWSYDGSKGGNFIWSADYTSRQGNLRHFELSLDINFTKKDDKGRTPVNGVIHQTGYYLDENKGKWVSFNFSGVEIWSTDRMVGHNVFTGWLRGGMNEQPGPRASLTLDNNTDKDYSIFLTYSCLKFFEKSWECNEGKWVVHVVETGDIDYHSDIKDGPVMGFKEVKDLNISDIPSILKQFNLSALDFAPALYDVFITPTNPKINTQKDQVKTLEFVVKNFGNKEITGLNYDLDIGEASLMEVVSADLPASLDIGEIKQGKITVYFKEEQRQTLTLWVKPNEPEVDTSDNMALFDVVVGSPPDFSQIPERVAYHGDTGVIINVTREPYTEVEYNPETSETQGAVLTIISGTDKIRTIYGGYWNKESINPTMEAFVSPLFGPEALFYTPFFSSLTIGGKMLTGDREIVDYKVRITNSKTGEYYETPKMQSSFKYHYNPRELIPNFEMCVDYVSEVILTGANEEIIDIVQPEPFNLCNNLGVSSSVISNNYFRTSRLQKQEGNYVVVTPVFSSGLFKDLNVNYFVEFSDPKNSKQKYRTPVLNIQNGTQVIPLADIIGNRAVDFVRGESFSGKVVLLNDLAGKFHIDLNDVSFDLSSGGIMFSCVRMTGRDCLESYNGKYLYGFAGTLGFDNFRLFNQDKQKSDMFLCYNNEFYQCGSGNYGNLSKNIAAEGQQVNVWRCSSGVWQRDESFGNVIDLNVNISNVLGNRQVETFTYNKTVVNCSGTLKVFTKSSIPAVSDKYELISSNLPEIYSIRVFSDSISVINNYPNKVEIGDYYFVCSSVDFTVYEKTIQEEREFYYDLEVKSTDTSASRSFNFDWNNWNVTFSFGVNILVDFDTSFLLKDEYFYISIPVTGTYSGFDVLDENFNWLTQMNAPFINTYFPLARDAPGDNHCPDSIYHSNCYMDKNILVNIFENTDLRLVIKDASNEDIVFDDSFNGKERLSYYMTVLGGKFGFQGLDLNQEDIKRITSNLSTGKIYDVYVSVVSNNADLFRYWPENKPKRFIYVDGWEFILNNELLYSRFFGVQNFPNVLSAVLYKQADGSYVPELAISYTNANFQFDKCDGSYKKMSTDKRYISLISGCDYPHGILIYYKDVKKALYNSLTLTLTPLKSGQQIETKRSQFNCKIGKFDGICTRSNYGYSFVYIDDRNNLMYRIDLAEGSGKFLKKYRDVSANGTIGNEYDLAIYDILSQIDRHPIKDFEIDNKYRYPVRIASYKTMFEEHYPNKRPVLYPDLIREEDQRIYGISPSVFNKKQTPLRVGVTGNVNIYDDKMNLLLTNKSVNSFSYLVDLNLTRGELYFIYYSDRIFKGQSAGGNHDKFLWVDEYSDWFFENNLDKYTNSAYLFNASYLFYMIPFSSLSPNKKMDSLDFLFSIDPANWSTEPYDLTRFSRDVAYYCCFDCNLTQKGGNRRGDADTIVARANSVGRSITQKITEKMGVSMFRTYKLNVKQSDDIYGYFNIAPKNCNNRYNFGNSNMRDVVCSSGVSGSTFSFSCSWSNINELRVYTLTMSQTFINRTTTQVANLPTEILVDMRDNFFHPVLSHYLGILPPTPILNSSYGTFDDYELCS